MVSKSLHTLSKIRAVDIDINAIHTYKANLEHDAKLYFGSVNNFLFDVVTGRNRRLPKRGEIDFILAGSPCQGFSNANPTGHESLKSLSNSALVCTTISAIDFYRPKYAILENVPAMATTRKYRGQTVSVSNQLMCALIGMGYQCRCLLLDAWHFGAPQSRTRLFIEIAAPGCALPEIPYGSHAHPSYVKSRAVGKTAANIRFAERNFNTLTSFPPVKLEDFWGDLPRIGNGHLGICVPYPDHKTYWTPNARDRGLYARIPRIEPRDQSRSAQLGGYAEALQRDLIPEHLKRWKKETNPANDKRFTRIAADGLAPTVTCRMTPWSTVGGKVLHYCEDRVMTNLEAKRAQGFFDTDVLVGRAASAYRIIGNSVCRQVAFALGGRLAEAVKKGPEGSGTGIVVNDLLPASKTDKVEISKTHTTPKPTKFMVLIKSRPKMTFDGESEGTDSDDMDLSKDNVRVKFTLEARVNRLEVSVTSTPRKRIRISVDDETDEESSRTPHR
jgi:DNA (cytosine-5)-methyltransferase 1